MDREELRKSFEVVEETKAEICRFVKDFFEKYRPIIPLDEPFQNKVTYEISSKKYGNLAISLLKEEESGNWEYVITALEFSKSVIIPKEEVEFKAKGDLFLGCVQSHPKIAGTYLALGKAKFA